MQPCLAVQLRKDRAHYINHPLELPLHSEEEFVERFWSGVTERTRVIYISHTTSPTALTFPCKKFAGGRAAGHVERDRRAHVPGQRDLYLDDIGCDFYTGNCHKWMGGPKGSAFLYVRPEVQHLIEPLIVGHGWHPGEKIEQAAARLCRAIWHADLAAFLAIPAAIDYMQAHDWSQVRARCYQMALTTKRTVEQMFDTESICPETFAWFSQLCPVRLPDQTDMGKLGQILREQYQIEMPMITWHTFKIARLSVQIYTTQAELDTFVGALEKHVPECLVKS
ncbi:MAG: aminotransferase class V-fold PLP-dependent enzyme [Caldilineaceae bacterium]